MKFLDESFLLYNDKARTLYHDHAKNMPIYDFHNHLVVSEIAQDISYDNITKVWLGGDHYKWRIMRATGADEANITGNGSDRAKFDVYVKAVEQSPGNPLYHWSHLELQRYFGIEDVICQANADKIFNESAQKIEKLSVRKLINMSNVDALLTIQDPADTLEHHSSVLADESVKFSVCPAYRPDNALKIYLDGFKDYIQKLGESADININSFDELKQALSKRMDFFETLGCTSSDHGLDTITFKRAKYTDVDKVFKGAMFGRKLTDEEITIYQSELLVFLGGEYSKRNWVMAIHIGALRNVNTKMFNIIGADTGYDTCHDAPVAEAMAGLLDSIEQENGLPKTALFCLNPKDYYSLITIGSSFMRDIPGKVQFGPAWWHLDHIDGMEKQLRDVSSLGSLGYFIGMLTDSRSFLSFPRHEYFRRILCNYMGELVEKGQAPWDEKWLGKMIEDISFNNAKKFFDK